MANSARIDELRKKFDENPRRYFAPLANEYRKSGDLAQAVFILEEYLPQQPGHISGHIVYGQTLFELGRDEEAKRVFETALSLDPENLIALRHLGHISRQAGDFDAARTWYQRLLEADPRDAEIEQLLGSLDAAAQAHAAELSRPTQSAPSPSPSMPEVDDTPLMVEHLVQQEAPGAPPRAETHPLAPPPLPEREAAQPELATLVTPAEPPPLPVAEAPEAPDEPVEVTEELLDLNDFSFGSLGAASAPPTGDAQPSVSSEHETEAETETVAESEATPSESGHGTERVEATSAPSDVEPSSTDDGFVPFSDLAPPVVDSNAANVDGLETYTFESPQGSVAEADEDVGSFYMDSPETPAGLAESVEPAEGFESVEMEFAAEASVAGEADAHEHADEGVEHEHADAIEGRGDTDAGDHFAADASAARELTPPTSTPIASPAVSRTPTSTPIATPALATPVVANAVPEAPPEVPAESDAFATETMAKLYLGQGHLESALGIYRTLSARHPDDESLRRQIEEIEERVLRRRREPTPATRAAAIDSDAADDSVDDEFAAATPRTGVPTIRDFLLGLIRRGAPSGARVETSEPPGGAGEGTIDSLFDSGGELDDDLLAADTLAQAFAPEPEPEALQGRPARQAANELSLDRVFRQPTPAHAGDASGFSFDQFFSGERTDDSHAVAPDKPDPDDIEQFNAWLNGLKKS
jgi:tetratricopeptide (TPR) repeat protein